MNTITSFRIDVREVQDNSVVLNIWGIYRDGTQKLLGQPHLIEGDSVLVGAPKEEASPEISA